MFVITMNSLPTEILLEISKYCWWKLLFVNHYLHDLANHHIEIYQNKDNVYNNLCIAIGDRYIGLVKLALLSHDLKAQSHYVTFYGISRAIKSGSIEIVKLIIDYRDGEDVFDWNECTENAARYGHIKLVKFFLNKGASNYNSFMAQAASGGHLHIIQYLRPMIKYSNYRITTWNWIMECA
ncbi:unnamed protein product, partial [marine sediment metagenome]